MRIRKGKKGGTPPGTPPDWNEMWDDYERDGARITKSRYLNLLQELLDLARSPSLA